MEYGAIYLHKKESQVRILTETGEVIDRRIPTTRERLTALFWGRPHARIVIEASTESEWVAQHLEALGHEAIVADPNFGLMYGHRSRRVKTDRRDVAAGARERPEARVGAHRDFPDDDRVLGDVDVADAMHPPAGRMRKVRHGVSPRVPDRCRGEGSPA